MEIRNDAKTYGIRTAYQATYGHKEAACAYLEQPSARQGSVLRYHAPLLEVESVEIVTIKKNQL